MNSYADIDKEDTPASPEEERSKDGNDRLHPDEDLTHGDEGIDDPDVTAAG